MKTKINIIGAGVAGLCAGSYLQMNGYDTEIFEHNAVPGGLVTAWDRKGYRFDGCIHWLMGASPSNKMYNHWNELIDMKNLDMVFSKTFFTVEDENGKQLNVFKNVDALKSELLEKAPEDRVEILRFIKVIRKLSKTTFFRDKTPEVMSKWDGLKMLLKMIKILPLFKSWGSITLEEYSRRFKNPLLKRVIHDGFVPNMAAIFLLFTLADLHRKGSGYPIGGSKNFSRLLEKRYTDLGGRIHYNARVHKILTSKNESKTKACGIELNDGSEFKSDVVISAADGYSTIFEMLNGEFVDDTIRGYYKDMDVFSSFLQVSFGIDRAFDPDMEHLSLQLKEPLDIDPQTRVDSVSFRIFAFDPTLAPKGKTAVTSNIFTFNYQYWIDLRKNDLNKYKAEKQRIAHALAEILEKRFGGVKDKIEVIDVSTPATVVRYTNNWKGSFEGWVMTPKMGFKRMNKQLPGLDNFYMIGQWVSPGGGIPSGLMTGRGLAQILCKNDEKKFTTRHF